MIVLAEIREKIYYLPEAKTDFIFPIVSENQLTYALLDALTIIMASKQQTSLRTKDRVEAQRLFVAHSETITQPALVNRTWQDVIDAYVQQGKESSQDRSRSSAA